MKVYVVVDSIDYEGYGIPLAVFDQKDLAEKHVNENGGFIQGSYNLHIFTYELNQEGELNDELDSN